MKAVKRALLLSVFAACSADEEPTDKDFPGRGYRTIYAEVRTDFEPRLCPGELDKIDEKVEALSELFEVAPPEPLVVRITDSFPVPSCSSGAVGCFKSPFVTAMSRALEHELVHAVSHPLGIESVFWREGLAQAYGEAGLPRGWVPVSVSAVKEGLSSEDYRTAGHFSRWLIEAEGLDAFLLATTESDVETVYGMSLDELEERYEEEAPWMYTGSDICSEPRLDFDGQGLVAGVTVSCDDETGARVGEPFPFAEHLGVARILEIEEAGTFEFQLEGGFGVFVRGCATEVLDEEPGPMHPSTGAPEGFVEAGDSDRYEMEEGTYRVSLYAGEYLDEDRVQLTVLRVDE